jgi:hypothetical protein
MLRALRMVTPVHKPGGEVESYCTSCRADRVHRIIALMNGQPKKVECLSCKGHHLYRATQAQKEAMAAHKRASRGERTSTSSLSRSRPSMPARPKEDLSQTWEKAIAGRALTDFKPYRIDQTFVKGELVRHSKFGEGVVITVVDATKCEILFKDGLRTLAQATSLPG